MAVILLKFSKKLEGKLELYLAIAYAEKALPGNSGVIAAYFSLTFSNGEFLYNY